MKAIVKTLLGHRPSPTERVDLDMLERDWSYRPSRPDGLTTAVRLRALRGLRHAPASVAISPVYPAPRWIVYFVYLPAGRLDAGHRFTLERLRQGDARLCVICATPNAGLVPEELRSTADATYWKALPGYDFSAYALAIDEIARHSAGAEVLVMNDSVFGPFADVEAIWPMMRWDLTGFTASAQLQNHVQSYAFHLRHVTLDTAKALRTVLPRTRAFDDYVGVVYWQESRFAHVAARSMSVGALWYADGIRCGDPTTYAALPLVRSGFPFLKRSLLSKNAHLADPDEVRDVLRTLGHPVTDTQ